MLMELGSLGYTARHVDGTGQPNVYTARHVDGTGQPNVYTARHVDGTGQPTVYIEQDMLMELGSLGYI